MEKISTRIVDEFWIDNDTYIVCCDDYIQQATDGTMSELHLEVEYWEDEKERVTNGSLDYKKILDRELTRLEKVISDLKAMESKKY